MKKHNQPVILPLVTKLTKFICAGDGWAFPYNGNYVKVILSYTFIKGIERYVLFVTDADDHNFTKSFDSVDNAIDCYNSVCDGAIPQDFYNKGWG